MDSDNIIISVPYIYQLEGLMPRARKIRQYIAIDRTDVIIKRVKENPVFVSGSYKSDYSHLNPEMFLDIFHGYENKIYGACGSYSMNLSSELKNMKHKKNLPIFFQQKNINIIKNYSLKHLDNNNVIINKLLLGINDKNDLNHKKELLDKIKIIHGFLALKKMNNDFNSEELIVPSSLKQIISNNQDYVIKKIHDYFKHHVIINNEFFTCDLDYDTGIKFNYNNEIYINENVFYQNKYIGAPIYNINSYENLMTNCKNYYILNKDFLRNQYDFEMRFKNLSLMIGDIIQQYVTAHIFIKQDSLLNLKNILEKNINNEDEIYYFFHDIKQYINDVFKNNIFHKDNKDFVLQKISLLEDLFKKELNFFNDEKIKTFYDYKTKKGSYINFNELPFDETNIDSREQHIIL
jgi:hypothetical protein